MKRVLLITGLVLCKLLLYAQYCEGLYISPISSSTICDPNPWVVIFEDDFEYLNTDVWRHTNGLLNGSRFIYDNPEHQYYTSGENMTIENGILKIWAEGVDPFWDKIEHWKDPTDMIQLENGNEIVNWTEYFYKSGRIETYRTFSYGKFEARIRMSQADGAWHAFWLWNNNPYREIDIFEVMDNEFDKYKMNVYYDYNGEGRDECGRNINQVYMEEWHTFGLSWEKNFIIWYIDGVEVNRTVHYYSLLGQEIGCNLNDFTQYIMNKIYPRGDPMMLQINLAVYNNQYAPNNHENFYETIEVDWVKIYKRWNPSIVSITNQTDYPIVNNLYNTILGQNVSFNCDYVVPTDEFLKVQAQDYIRLTPGFKADKGSEVRLEIDSNIDNKSSSALSSEMSSYSDFADNREDNTKTLINNYFVNVKPNPTNGKFDLEFGNIKNASINILNNIGVSVFSLDKLESDNITLDLTYFPKGMYLVCYSISESDIFLTKKVIIQ